MKIPKMFYLALGLVLIIYSPALVNFYTHDDFFHLVISQASNFKDFINFFNPFNPPLDFGWYRPLTTQIFYFIGQYLFLLNPFLLHLLQFLAFSFMSFLAYKLMFEITGSEKISSLGIFLYLVSSTHFAHLYSFSVFQEVGLGIAYFSTMIFFLRFLSSNKLSQYIFSLALFVIGLTTKESAVTIPFVLGLLSIWKKKYSTLKYLIPHIVILLIYVYIRYQYYGFAEGDSYLWHFDTQIISTTAWYVLWSLNIPEMFVDFVTLDLKINPNLFKYYAQESTIIFTLFISILGLIIFSLRDFLLRPRKNYTPLLLVGMLWFLISVGPVLLLPWHRFTFYLTVPLLPAALVLAHLLEVGLGKKTQRLFLTVWLLLCIQTVDLTWRTNWITRGSQTASRVNNYIQENIQSWPAGTTLVFYDSLMDESLPWLPSGVLKNVLSDNNYFKIFTPDRLTAVYSQSKPDKILPDQILIPARQFLGY